MCINISTFQTQVCSRCDVLLARPAVYPGWQDEHHLAARHRQGEGEDHQEESGVAQERPEGHLRRPREPVLRPGDLSFWINFALKQFVGLCFLVINDDHESTAFI